MLQHFVLAFGNFRSIAAYMPTNTSNGILARERKAAHSSHLSTSAEILPSASTALRQTAEISQFLSSKSFLISCFQRFTSKQSLRLSAVESSSFP
jgi:hypothetical protein